MKMKLVFVKVSCITNRIAARKLSSCPTNFIVVRQQMEKTVL
jgi:hypothetical protein